MQKRALSLLLLPALCSCASPATQFENNPEQYGYYVATTDMYSTSPLVLVNGTSHATITLYPRKSGNAGTYYFEAVMPPGAYYVDSYSPYAGSSIKLPVDSTRIDISAGCFNFGGLLTLSPDAGEMTFVDVFRLKDIENLPEEYREVARNHDICSAALNEQNKRYSRASLQGLITL